MNIYTRRRETQEAAGSKSGGGGQSERSAERPAGAEWRDQEMLVLSSSDVYTVVWASRWCSSQLYRPRPPRMSVNESLEIGAIECSALFLEIILAASCERIPPPRRKNTRGSLPITCFLLGRQGFAEFWQNTLFWQVARLVKSEK